MVNKVIIYLTISDILILSAFGLINPIFAIFLNEGITGGSIAAAGIASAIFLIVKSLIQMPLSIYIDKNKDKILFLLGGTFFIAAVPFIYFFSPSIGFIYFSQVIYGIGAAMAYPAWYSLFTMHLDKKHRGLEYSIWSTGVGIGTALTAYLGAIFAKFYGFRNLFLIVGITSFLGMLVLLFLSRKFLKKVDGVEGFILHHAKK